MEENKVSMKDYLKAMGPGAIMAASILGPGTVTTASVQGTDYGYTSLWILLLACAIAYFIQEPATRISIACRETMISAVRKHIGISISKILWLVIFIGCIAYQTGNLSGASMAMVYFFPNTSSLVWSISMNLFALVLVILNRYKIIESMNQIFIFLMVSAFVMTAFISKPNTSELIAKGFSFQIPGNNGLLALSLLATTAVPHLLLGYSTFLRKKYPDSTESKRDIQLARFDLAFNMFITFCITGAIIISAATLLHPMGISISSASDMSVQLEPLLGKFAGVFFAIGLWAASISSVLYHVSVHNLLFAQAFQVEESLKEKHSKIIIGLVVLIPILIIMIFQTSPVQIIIVAQALNGIALPFVCIVCWILLNKKELMGDYINNKTQNIIMGSISVITLLFACNAFISVVKNIMNLLT